MNKKHTSTRLVFLVTFTLVSILALSLNAGIFKSANVAITAQKTQQEVRIDWDDCDSHFWWGEKWSDAAGWYAPVLSWGSYHDKDCLKCEWTQSDAWAGLIRTDWVFPDENWGYPVVGFRADIYVESSQDWTDIILQPRAHNFDTTIESLSDPSATNLTTNSWHTCTWSFTNSADYSQVAGVVFLIDNLGNAPAAVYFDNFRLVTAEGEEIWDNVDDPSYSWKYVDGSDAVNWSYHPDNWIAGLEPITHTNTSTSTKAGSIYMKWNAANSTATEAKVESKDLGNVDWSAYHSVGAEVYCTSIDAGIFVGFWDGSSWIGTAQKMVTTPDAWQTIEWDIPSGDFDWTSVDRLIFHVATDEEANGEIWIDNVHFLE